MDIYPQSHKTKRRNTQTKVKISSKQNNTKDYNHILNEIQDKKYKFNSVSEIRHGDYREMFSQLNFNTHDSNYYSILSEKNKKVCYEEEFGETSSVDSDFTISSDIEKNLNFLEEIDSDEDINKSKMVIKKLSNEKRDDNLKLFSMDDMKNFSIANWKTNSNSKITIKKVEPNKSNLNELQTNSIDNFLNINSPSISQKINRTQNSNSCFYKYNLSNHNSYDNNLLKINSGHNIFNQYSRHGSSENAVPTQFINSNFFNKPNINLPNGKVYNNPYNQYNIGQFNNQYNVYGSQFSINHFNSNCFSGNQPNMNMSQFNNHVNNNSLFVNNQNNSNFNNVMDDKYILDNVLVLLKDQNGCRLIQKKIEEKNSDYVIKLFEKIQNNLNDIINDQFGNYVIQKIIEYIYNDNNNITRFLEIIKNNLFFISVNQFGTRVFQKILDYFCTNYTNNLIINNIFKELIENNILDLILDTNGNHVFQKILIIYPKNENQFIYDELIKVSLDVAKSKKGGCIFQRAFDLANPTQKKDLINSLLISIDTLINHEFGNFIIQQIIFLKDIDSNLKIIDFIKLNLLNLARKKFSSNVIDKCIILEDDGVYKDIRNDLIDFMINNKHIMELIGDQYGNYVIQKTLLVSDGIRFMAIIQEIKSVLKNLKQSTHGRKIYDNLMKEYGKYFNTNKIYEIKKNIIKLES